MIETVPHAIEGSRKAGVRRITERMIEAAELAGRFDGLPEGVTKGQVLAAFKSAAPYMKVSGQIVAFIDTLMAFSQEQDWVGFSRPVVWPSNDKLQEKLNRDERSVQRYIRQALDLGFIVERTGPNGKRSGHRSKGRSGVIVKAYGFDLSPLAVRYEEFVREAAQGAAARQHMKALRSQGGACVREIRQMANYYHEERPQLRAEARTDDFMASVAQHEDQATALLERLDKAYKQLDGKSLETLLETLQQEVRLFHAELLSVLPEGPLATAREAEEAGQEAGDKPSGDVDTSNNTVDNKNIMSTKGDKSVTHNTTTTQPQSAKADTSSGYSVKGTAQMRGKLSEDLDGKDSMSDPCPQENEKLDEPNIPIELVVQISPRYAHLIGCSQPDWPRLAKIAEGMKDSLGISDHAWRQAVDAMGPAHLAACMAIIDAKRDRLRSAGGYLRGMTNAHLAGELNVESSIYGLRNIH